MKFVVTGGAGFIGSHLVEKLLYDGHSVVVIDDLSAGRREYLPEESNNFTFIKADIADWNDLSRKFRNFEKVDGLFHLAAKARIQLSMLDPIRTHNSNVNGIFNILELMRMCGIKNIVFSSSASYYGLKVKIPCKEISEPDCLNPYAVSKCIGEQYCKSWGKAFGINNICLRYFNVYGERAPVEGAYATVINLFFRQVLKDKIPMTIVGDGEQRRDFVHVSDVVKANIFSMERMVNGILPGNGESFNVGSGVNYSVNEVADIIKRCIENYYNNFHTLGWPGGCNIVIVPVFDPVYIPYRHGESRETLSDQTKIKQFFNWSPEVVDLEKKLEEMILYYLKRFS